MSPARRTLTSDHVAAALVCACKLLNEDPEAVLNGSMGSRARQYAYHAIKVCFPELEARSIARMVGAPNPTTFVGQAAHLHVKRWFSAAHLRTVRASLNVMKAVQVPPAPAGAKPGKPKPVPRAAPELNPEEKAARRRANLAKGQAARAEKLAARRAAGQPINQPEERQFEPDGSQALDAIRQEFGVTTGAGPAPALCRPAPDKLPRAKWPVDIWKAPRPRAQARIDVTAEFCGDPPPERSALAQKGSAP